LIFPIGDSGVDRCDLDREGSSASAGRSAYFLTAAVIDAFGGPEVLRLNRDHLPRDDICPRPIAGSRCIIPCMS